ncbi:hypothetical protein CBR_g31046 [Chara braunii]|uniref:CCHC-type domain-containing protein n=1 Tax=Chara braunii TaxID=69332 RepID=A0A388LE49_CHABU|nr:hypothetical protein CBR_g31046 [Chara braunii]|eukprot:GBG80586.1 hypothetical protein CBR_g31046 [Chara braunii]
MNVAPQGWTNAVAMVQRHMIRTMQTVSPHITQPYLDDLTVKGPKEKEEDEVMPGVRRFVWKHIQDTDQVLSLLEEHNLMASGPKLKHCMREATILGFVCNESGRRPNVKKTDKIIEWPVPFRSITDVRSFLRACGFWRSFVKDFASKMEHLRKLVRQDKEWVWGEDQEEAVDKMKGEFKEGGLVLGGPNYEATEEKPFVIEADVGPTALGGVLIQADTEGKERPLSCVSHHIWLAPKGYEQKEELVLKPFQEEDPWGSKDVGCMMKLALAGTHSLVEEVRTIEEGPTQVEEHEQLMGGMYLLTNTLLQGGFDRGRSFDPMESEILVPESQEDEFEDGEIREAFRAEEYDGIYWELGLLLSCEMRDRDASAKAQKMRHLYRKGQERSAQRPGEPLHSRLEREVDAVVHLDLLFMPCRENECNYIFDARDNVTGFVDGRAIRTKTGPVLANCMEEYYLRYPFVKEFVMDRGSEFTSNEVRTLLAGYGVVANYTTAAHPQVNAPVERGHSTIKNLLAKWTEGKPDQWPKFLRVAFFVENVTVKRTTKYAPATLWYGRHATFLIESFMKTWRRHDLEVNLSFEELLDIRARQVGAAEERLREAAVQVERSRIEDKMRWDQMARAETEAAGIVPTPPIDPKTSEQRINELWARYEGQRDAARQRSQGTGQADEKVDELREAGDLGFSATRMAVDRVDRRIREVTVTSFDRCSLLSDELATRKLEVEHLTTQVAKERPRSQAREIEWERRFGELTAIVDRLLAAGVAEQTVRAGVDGQDRGTQVSPSQETAAESPRQRRPTEGVSLDLAEGEATRRIEGEAVGAGASVEITMQPRVSSSHEARVEGLVQGPPYPSAEESGAQESLMAMSTKRRGSRLHELVAVMGIGTPQERPQILDTPEDEMVAATERPREERLPELDTPEYGPVSAAVRGGEGTEAVELGSQGRIGLPLCHEVTAKAMGTPSASSFRARKKKIARWFDASCFWCKKEGHRALDCPELLEDRAEGRVAEIDGKFYDKQGRIWPPLPFPEDAVPPLVSPTAPSGAVASPNSGAPAIRVTVQRPATTVATRPAAPPSAPLAGTRGSRDVGVGRSTPANEPPPLRDGVGSAAFDEESTRAFIESRRWGGSASSSASALASVFRSARQSDVARGGTAVAPGASPRSSPEHPWLPPPPSRAAQRPVVHHAHGTAHPDPSHAPADARHSASVPRFGEQVDHGVPAAEVPPPVSDSSPTPVPTTTGGGRSAPQPPPVLAGMLDPLQGIRDLAVALSTAPVSPGGLLDAGVLGGRATTGRCRGTYRQQAVTSYYSDPLKRAWHLQIMRFIVESGMSFNSTKLESFKQIGAVYLSIDVMRGKKDASVLTNAWLKRVKSMDVQLSDITAFVTDSAGVNVATMEVFQKYESVKHIFWISCVAHIMDLILEDISGIDWVASRISQARLVTRLEVPRAEKLVRCHWNLRLLDRPSLCDDGVGERPGVFGKWVHYWQAVEDEAAVDQQLIRGTGALAKVTEEELSLARERIRVISRMGAERRVAELDRRRRRADGRGHVGHGRAGVRGRTRGDAGFAPRTRRQRTDSGIRRARMRWDEGNFLFDNTSSDDDDFFALGTRASTGDDRGDADDRGDNRGDGDDRGDGAGPGGGGGGGGGDGAGPAGVGTRRLRHGGRRDDSIASRVRRRRVHIAIDTGARNMRQDAVAVSEDEMGDPSNETQRDLVHTEELASNTDVIVTEEDTGFRITHPRSPAPVGLAEEVAQNRRGGPHVAAQRSLECSLEPASGDFLAQGGYGSQLLSDGLSSVHPPEEGPQREPHRGPAETLEARPPGVIRSDGGEGVSEDTAQPGSADGGRSFRGGIERRGLSTAHPSIVRPSTQDVGDGHKDEPRPHLTGMSDIMCPPPSLPSAADPAAHGQAEPSALPTRSFYDGAGMDRRAGDIGQTLAYGPADVPAGVRSIGNFDGTCHDSMKVYEEQHGRPILANTTDVNDTRTATARLSWARKKGTSVSIPYHRRRVHPFFRNRDETRQMPAAADGQGGRREVTEWTKQVEVRRDEAERSSSTTTAPQPLRAVRPQAPTILMTPITSRGSVRRTEMTAEVVA